ncbi:uncharacterized protein CCR75_002124 [Bremia lactucae]|uniref:Uncharacterized protein n=1 Tax=Bremia lactucae TaxID=4779 RepID=A0A976FDV4_BRELC|nr:hypothetical protein CCR75_002124 [Bremia lactucae]
MRGLNLGGVVEFCRVLTCQPQLLLPQLSLGAVPNASILTHLYIAFWSTHASDMTEVPFQKLRDRGFRGVIFDKDNTLTIPHEIAIPSHFASSLDECRRVFGDSGVVVFSNSAGSVDDKDGNQATKIEEELHVAVLRHKHKKPGGITCVQKHFEKLNPQTLVIIGDRYSTDVLFGNLNGLLTIRTEQFLPESESFVNWQLQRIEKAAVRMLISAGVKPPTHPLWDNIEA